LINREIDLLKVDDIGNNCYSYIAEENKAEFMEFTQKIKIPIQVKESEKINKMFNIDSIKSIINVDINLNNKSKSYGLFNPNMIHYMLYLRYLQVQYKSLYVPVRNFSEKNKERDVFFYNLTAYDLSDKQKTLNKHVKIYMNTLYSYLPHNIYWIDGDQNYIDNNLIKILKIHNTNINVSDQRYIMLKLTIVVSDDMLHANALIYDRLKKEAWRFEPYGITNIGDDNKDTESMDHELHKLLESIYGKITYYTPDDYLVGLNFQLVDGEDNEINKNLGDPQGYCLAWSLWFINVVLANPDKNVKDIMKNFFNREHIDEILSEEEEYKIRSGNYYLDFIRKYAHKLDDEKNKILQSIGVKQYNYYNNYMKDDVYDKVLKLFQLNPTYDTDGIEIVDEKQKLMKDIENIRPET
jgi:hypothetical protein